MSRGDDVREPATREPQIAASILDEDEPASPRWRRILALVGLWSIPAVAFALLGDRQTTDDGEPLRPGWQTVVVFAYPWYLCALITPVVLAVGRRHPLTGLRGWRTLLVHGGAMLLAAVVFVTLGTAISFLIDDPFAPAGESLPARAARLAGNGIPFTMVMYWLILGVGGAVETRRELARRTLQASRVEAQLSRARLDALQAQLRPHFLFNTLNAIAALVRKAENERAVRMIAHLSELLRHSLGAHDRAGIPLAEELELLRAYLRIEQERVGDRVRVEIDGDRALDAAVVPPLVLQPLAENAVRHGVVPSRERCTVRVTARAHGDRLRLDVVNDGVPLAADSATRRQGVGIANTTERLRTLYGDDASFRLGTTADGDTSARIELPLHIEGDGGAGEP